MPLHLGRRVATSLSLHQVPQFSPRRIFSCKILGEEERINRRQVCVSVSVRACVRACARSGVCVYIFFSPPPLVPRGGTSFTRARAPPHARTHTHTHTHTQNRVTSLIQQFNADNIVLTTWIGLITFKSTFEYRERCIRQSQYS